MGLSLFDEQQPFLMGLDFSPGSGTAFAQLISGLGQKTRFDSILIRNLDTIDHVMELGLQPAGINYIIGSVNVPAASSLVATVPVDLIGTVIVNPQIALIIPATGTINIRCVVACATANVKVIGLGGFL
jgi:hypothetical protein